MNYRRWGTAVGLVLLLLAVTVWGLPALARWQAEAWLQDNGAEGATIAELSWNPFVGRVRLSGVEAGAGQDQRLRLGLLELDVDMGALFSKQVFLEHLHLADLDMDVLVAEDGKISLGPVLLPSADPAAEPEPTDDEATPWGVGLAGLQVERVSLGVRSGDLGGDLGLTSLALGRLSTWTADDASRLGVQATVDGAVLTVDGEVTPLSETPGASLQLALKGVDLATYRPLLLSLAGNSYGLAGILDINQTLDLSLTAAGQPVVKSTGDLTLTSVGAEVPEGKVAGDRIHWQGGVALAADGRSELRGDLTLAGMGAEAPEGKVTGERIHWQGAVVLAADGTPNMRGDLKLAGVRADLPEQETAAVTLAELRLTGINVESAEQVAVALVELDTLVAMPQPGNRPAMLQVPTTRLQNLAWSTSEGLQMQDLTFGQVQVAVVRQADGSVLLAPALVALQGPAESSADPAADAGGVPTAAATGAPTEAATAAAVPAADATGDSVGATPPMRIRLAKLALTDATVTVTDASVTPAFATTLAPVNLTLTGLDTAFPDQPVGLDLTVQQQDNTKLHISGTLLPLADAPGADLVLDLDGLDLPQISSYVPGYSLETGRLALDSTIKVRGDTLEVQNRLLLERLKLSGKAGEDIPGFAQGLALPLETALDLLRDRKDRIKLDIPVTGLLSDPKVGMGGIIRRATQGALQKAAFSYIKNALQPLGTILMVADLAGEAAKPRFAPVEFLANTSTLSDTQQAYLDKIGTVLNERPGLSLTICGVATAADQPPAPAAQEGDAAATSEAQDTVAAAPEIAPEVVARWQLDHAEARALAVRRYLTAEQGVAQDRLYACQARVDNAEDAKPRVGLRL